MGVFEEAKGKLKQAIGELPAEVLVPPPPPDPASAESVLPDLAKLKLPPATDPRALP